MPENMLAYHSDPKIKEAILAQLAAHRLADEIIHGIYWEKGKGCAVGCTIHSGNHAEYETRFGIPSHLAYLEDRIFEGMRNGKSKEWPEQFMGAIKPGADLTRVHWRFLHWLLTDETVNPGIKHRLVADAVPGCAEIMAILIRDGQVDEEKRSAAESAARAAALSAESEIWAAESEIWAARAAARSAESAARAAESAARAAESAAWAAAWSAAWSARAARAAESAAWVAAWSAESAARAAESAWSAWSAKAARAAESAAWEAARAAYKRMADKLVELLEAA